MEAKDTVMNFMRIEEIDAKNAASNFTDALWDVAREQAKISFKAGTKEVVDYIVGLNLELTTVKELLNSSRWQFQLKEWGIDVS